MKDFYLIRHGQSHANAGFPAVSYEDEALTPLGHEQAQITAAHLTKEPDLIVTSTYLRAQQTSAPTKAKFPNAQHEIWPIEEFHQIDPEVEEGLTVAQLIPLFHEHWRRHDPYYTQENGAESWADLLGRVEAFENHLRTTTAGRIYAFSHGFFIKAFLVKHIVGNQELALNMEGLDGLMNGVFWVGNCAITPGVVTDEGEILVGRFSNAHIPEPKRT